MTREAIGFQPEPTFMAVTSTSNDIHVDSAVVMLLRLRPKSRERSTFVDCAQPSVPGTSLARPT
jgi:hypothetical protein